MTKILIQLLLFGTSVSGQALSPVLGSVESCCNQGVDWGNKVEEECDSFPVPVKDIIPEMQQLCIATMEVCCTKRRREQQCLLGKTAALNGMECDVTALESKIGKETYKDCCMACTLGITVASMSQRCSGIAGSFGEPWQTPFTSCCQEYLDPTFPPDTTTSIMSNITTSTEAPADNIQCPVGFVYNSLMHVCDDQNECENDLDDCLDDEVCHNTIGSFICEPELGSSDDECPTGYRYFLISCIDINECQEEEPCKDDDICVNTDGSFLCQSQDTFKENESCPLGFKLSQGECIDINECQAGTNDCMDSQRCENTIGSFICVRYTTCGTGYTLNFQTGNCEDDDECAHGQHNCDALGPGYFCRNIKGSFRCEKKRCNIGEILDENGLCTTLTCGAGFEPGPFGNCLDIDECTFPNTCSRGEECVNTMGSYECLSNCEIGLKLNSALGICEDIDECALGSAQCFHGATCFNTIGSFRCSCGPGYREVNGVCKDINECLLNGRFLCGIDSECQNSEGSYRCICKQGFKNDGRRCKDIDECKEIPDVCGHSCQNLYGSYRCQCQPGYQLQSDMRTCSDIDECHENTGNGMCQGECVNEPGSFNCQCPAGYRLSSNGRECTDIDECNEGNPCKGQDQYCHNTRGGYKCTDVGCPPGYRVEHGQNHRCKRESTRCRSNDIACLKKPVSVSFNFISLIADLQIAQGGTDLFTMQSASYDYITAKFTLTFIRSIAAAGVQQASRSSFYIKTGVHQGTLSLAETIQGPQEIELELMMEMYYKGRFAGSALARIFIFVGRYRY